MNWENPLVREEIYKMMRWWLDKGVDGFRLNVINFLSKAPEYPEGKYSEGSPYTDGSPFYRNGPRIHDYLQEMHEKVFKHYKIVTVGECPGTRPHVHSSFFISAMQVPIWKTRSCSVHPRAKN